jgi:hypothetical protein
MKRFLLFIFVLSINISSNIDKKETYFFKAEKNINFDNYIISNLYKYFNLIYNENFFGEKEKHQQKKLKECLDEIIEDPEKKILTKILNSSFIASNISSKSEEIKVYESFRNRVPVYYGSVDKNYLWR